MFGQLPVTDGTRRVNTVALSVHTRLRYIRSPRTKSSGLPDANNARWLSIRKIAFFLGSAPRDGCCYPVFGSRLITIGHTTLGE